MNILGYDRLHSDSKFSRFKESVDIDRIMAILSGMIRKLNQDFMCMVGVDSTGLHAFSRTDPDDTCGYDHPADGVDLIDQPGRPRRSEQMMIYGMIGFFFAVRSTFKVFI